MPKAAPGKIRVGVGGWTFEPWRDGVFFPEGLAQAKELAHASRRLTTLEINGTYYRTQSPSTFAKWATETPDGFVFSVKALRFTTNRKVLAEAEESVGKFLGSGLTELGDKLGPILWQFAPTKKFEPEDFAAFLDLLPPERDGLRLRHAVEVRNVTFVDPAFIELARSRGVAIVYAHANDYPEIADPTADFIYARLQGSREDEPAGYTPTELDRWAQVAREWAGGGSPAGLEYVAGPPPKGDPRDVFLYVISGAKIRAPAAAMALIERLKD
ncbi:MAG TPA: DUF72 domain-containing protein [Caulobacteraceae bacterium]|nr:DUF72 domain-containing protein [Caulobacteraceae bacterium]